MSFTIERYIFVHDFLNPPAEDRSCDIDLKLINSSGSIALTKEATDNQTRYLLKISDPSVIKLTSHEQSSVERAIKNLVLVFNLNLVRTCLSTLQGEIPHPEVKLQPHETKVKVEQTPEGKHIQINETIMARDTIHIRIGTHEEVNEEHVLANLEKVAQVDRFGIQITTDLKVVNLAKALNEYENAMSIFDRLRIFKSLVNSLELCANWKGVDNTGPAIDSVIASVSNVPQTDVADWRNLYNRTKHVDRSPVDQEQFVIGMEKLPSILPSIREAAKRLIIDRLNQI